MCIEAEVGKCAAAHPTTVVAVRAPAMLSQRPVLTTPPRGMGDPSKHSIVGARSRPRKNANDGHHPIILVPANVAVIHELSDSQAAKTPSRRDDRNRSCPHPERNLGHVNELLLGLRHRHAVPLEELE